MSLRKKDMILEFARQNLSAREYRELVRLLELRDHEDEGVRVAVNERLLKIIQKLRYLNETSQTA